MLRSPHVRMTRGGGHKFQSDLVSCLKTAVPLFQRDRLKVGLQKIISLEKERFPDCSHPAALTPQPSTFPVDLSCLARTSQGLPTDLLQQ